VYESRKNGFRTRFYLVDHFRTGIFRCFYDPPQNPKLNCVFDNPDSTKNRFSCLCSKNGMNAGMISVAGHYYQSSGTTNESLRSAIMKLRNYTYAFVPLDFRPRIGLSFHNKCFTRFFCSKFKGFLS
jgi:hypothetical protein